MKVTKPFVVAAVVVAGVVGISGPASLLAQRPDSRVPRIMVPVFQGAENALRVQAADAVRSRLARDFNAKSLFVISKGDIEATLEASGYSPNEPLIPNDARMLASTLKADEYIEGTITRSPAGVHLDARLMVSRDKESAYTQPLPIAEAANMGQAAQILSKYIQDARRQLDSEQKCVQNYRAGKYREAITAAQAGIVAYPRATLARICIGNSYYGIKVNDSTTFALYRMEDSLLAIANEIRSIDPRSIPALRWAADIYQIRGDEEGAIEALLALLAADPTNVTLQKQVVNDLAARGKATLAGPIVREILNNNPADPGLLRTAWLIYLAAGEWDEAIAVASDMIKADTSLADTAYFIRLGGAHAGLNRTQEAAETFAAGTVKFPNNATLWVLRGNALRRVGQFPEAATALRHAVSLNPAVENGYVELARVFIDQDQLDSAIAVIDMGANAGANKSDLSKVALSLGNRVYRSANSSRDRAEFQKAITYLELADRLESSSDAKFIIGFAAFSMGQIATQEASSAKSCTLTKQAQDFFSKAQIYLPQAARDTKHRENATKILNAIPAFEPALRSMNNAFCK